MSKIGDRIKNWYKKDNEMVEEEFLRGLTWDKIPLPLKLEAEQRFYQNFQFEKLYTPAVEAGLEKYLPYVSIIFLVIILIKSW